VLLDGVDLTRVRPEDLARQVAFVAQETFIFEDTVRANVTLADPEPENVGSGSADSRDDDAVWRALELARVDDVVKGLPGGLDAVLGERGANLSGGQRQRLAIARALVRGPRLLILDDATSAVDPQVERAILTGLRRGEQSPTVLLVAYRMSSIALADEVVHLESGLVVDRGTMAELLERDPGFADLATAYRAESDRRAAR
jgi:ATP-binding cassette, subfamily B, bacterial